MRLNRPDTNQTRPLVTLALFAFNQERFISKAVEAAFAQDYERLEIILSDDSSADNTYRIMREMAADYEGNHIVRLNRNDENLGIGGHVKRIGEICSGEIVVMAAGDDISNSNRVSAIVSCYDNNTYAVFSDVYTCANGKQHILRQWLRNDHISLLDIVRSGGGIGRGASYSYRVECFHYPWKYPSAITCEDKLLPLRAIILGRIKYLPQSLLFYRVHDGSLSNRGDFVSAKENPIHIKEVVTTLRHSLRGGALSRTRAREIKRALVVYMKALPSYRAALLRHNKQNLTSRLMREGHTLLYSRKIYYHTYLRCRIARIADYCKQLVLFRGA